MLVLVFKNFIMATKNLKRPILGSVQLRETIPEVGYTFLNIFFAF